MNYYRRYCGDYLRDTPDLTLAEHGAYTLLLDLYYSIGCPIPGPLPTLYRICRADSEIERQAVDSVVNRFFPLNGDGLRHNKRADSELKISSTAIEKMRQAGINGAAKRWNGAPHRVGGRVTIEPPSTILQPPSLTSKTKTTPKKHSFVLPDWIPAEQWDAWVEARTRAKKPPTDWAKNLAVSKLKHLNDEGHPPAQVLMQSAFNNYPGLYPIKEQK